MFGYIYNHTFDPLNPSLNLLYSNHKGTDDYQFVFKIDLETTEKYILVSTTYAAYTLGAFLIIAKGSGIVKFSLLNVSSKCPSYSNSNKALKYRALTITFVSSIQLDLT